MLNVVLDRSERVEAGKASANPTNRQSAERIEAQATRLVNIVRASMPQYLGALSRGWPALRAPDPAATTRLTQVSRTLQLFLQRRDRAPSHDSHVRLLRNGEQIHQRKNVATRNATIIRSPYSI